MSAKKRTAHSPSLQVATTATKLDFPALVDAIRQIHEQCTAQVKRAVNVGLTLRNWVIGGYIREYEQNGADRSQYGKALLGTLAGRLRSQGLERMDERELRRYRLFYITYPGIWETLSPEFKSLLSVEFWSSLSAHLTPDALDRSNRESPSPEMGVPLSTLFASLSFSHLVELIAIGDPLKRTFYEIECIRGNWSVRALKRQIATLYFERSGLSTDKNKLAALVQRGVETAEPKLTVRDPYIFEFLGLRPKEVVEESDLEAALVANLREFLLELGNGFCLEAQQKSIVIGDTRAFVDLVFYHRVLKCHILVELKVDEFRHEHIGQLNTYVTWYRKHMMVVGDNPPIGLLLCTQKDHALVEYALEAIDNDLFVSKYQLELPTQKEIQDFLEKKRREVGEAITQ